MLLMDATIRSSRRALRKNQPTHHDIFLQHVSNMTSLRRNADPVTYSSPTASPTHQWRHRHIDSSAPSSSTTTSINDQPHQPTSPAGITNLHHRPTSPTSVTYYMHRQRQYRRIQTLTTSPTSPSPTPTDPGANTTNITKTTPTGPGTNITNANTD